MSINYSYRVFTEDTKPHKVCASEVTLRFASLRRPAARVRTCAADEAVVAMDTAGCCCNLAIWEAIAEATGTCEI